MDSLILAWSIFFGLFLSFPVGESPKQRIKTADKVSVWWDEPFCLESGGSC